MSSKSRTKGGRAGGSDFRRKSFVAGWSWPFFLPYRACMWYVRISIAIAERSAMCVSSSIFSSKLYVDFFLHICIAWCNAANLALVYQDVSFPYWIRFTESSWKETCLNEFCAIWRTIFHFFSIVAMAEQNAKILMVMSTHKNKKNYNISIGQPPVNKSSTEMSKFPQASYLECLGFISK